MPEFEDTKEVYCRQCVNTKKNKKSKPAVTMTDSDDDEDYNQTENCGSNSREKTTTRKSSRPKRAAADKATSKTADMLGMSKHKY